jgi:hypothetical protein
MGLDDMLKQQIRDRAPELKEKLVNEFSEVTQQDMDEASDDPDEIVDRVQNEDGSAARAGRAACPEGDAAVLTHAPRCSDNECAARAAQREGGSDG